jgi:hypothetical protein
MDGIQVSMYVGTRCVFRRRPLYGYDPPTKEGIRRQFKIFVVVLTNPQRRTSLHMLQIRKKHPIPIFYLWR